ncbi:MAG TPA: response regulator transcription factor [Solirubrobacterales bacterium]|nr:response regulator transcription factor [Solirubrobacterales bacterium]
MSKRGSAPSAGPPGDYLVVIAAEPVLRREITRVLEDAGRRTEAVASPTALAEYEIGSAGTVIFACDVDRPPEITALRRLRRENRDPAIVVVSPRATATAVRRTLDAGADALVFEPELDAALVVSVRAVESGQSVVPRNLRAGVERPYLSHRERQVLTLVCDGNTNAEIAEALFLAESTIKSHMASIFTKLGVHSRKEASAVFLDLYPVVPAQPDPELEEIQA